MKLFLFILQISFLSSQYLIIPMDFSQTDHLKAYGITFKYVKEEVKVEWFLNYRGGSFIFPDSEILRNDCAIKGVGYELMSSAEYSKARNMVEQENMEIISLEKAPRIAVYTPNNKLPWDDAVTLVLTYADVSYDKIYDEDILNGALEKYDWLHIHHEDFTGQYGKFYRVFKNAQWYIEQQFEAEQLAHKLGFSKVSESKKAVARTIKAYVEKGGFAFAMCSATDALDIALSAEHTDICATPFDGDPVDPNYQSKLEFDKTFAFTDFELLTDPNIYEYSTIDTPPSHRPVLKDAESDYFTLFEFSAKYDPIPTMLTQNHSNAIKGFMGQTTMFSKSTIKSHVTILGQIESTDQIKYIYGHSGKGFFAFYGGHDPEDYTHQVGDPPTDLSLHKNSPGYRLILNNILFPAAKKKKLKT
ncbi:MAG: asparagine synthetase B [Calditrichaeota bacterium]|nr:asparagine synthetase B [Calditrichota bacterium]